jgi:hypothetical protein
MESRICIGILIVVVKLNVAIRSIAEDHEIHRRTDSNRQSSARR